jgi:uncharacterized membrane protein
VQGAPRKPAARQHPVDRSDAKRQYPMGCRRWPLDPPDMLSELREKGSLLDHVPSLFLFSFLSTLTVDDGASRRLTCFRDAPPLLNAAPVIQIHAFAAIAAFAVGAIQLSASKGTILHRLVGWLWAVLMLTVAISSLFIHEIRLWGPWSPIHLLSILVLVTLPLAVLHARRHDVGQHRMAMLMLFTGALVIAGVFTFLPGRIMHSVAFGS